MSEEIPEPTSEPHIAPPEGDQTDNAEWLESTLERVISRLPPRTSVDETVIPPDASEVDSSLPS